MEQNMNYMFYNVLCTEVHWVAEPEWKVEKWRKRKEKSITTNCGGQQYTVHMHNHHTDDARIRVNSHILQQHRYGYIYIFEAYNVPNMGKARERERECEWETEGESIYTLYRNGKTVCDWRRKIRCWFSIWTCNIVCCQIRRDDIQTFENDDVEQNRGKFEAEGREALSHAHAHRVTHTHTDHALTLQRHLMCGWYRGKHMYVCRIKTQPLFPQLIWNTRNSFFLSLFFSRRGVCLDLKTEIDCLFSNQFFFLFIWISISFTLTNRNILLSIYKKKKTQTMKRE